MGTPRHKSKETCLLRIQGYQFLGVPMLPCSLGYQFVLVSILPCILGYRFVVVPMLPCSLGYQFVVVPILRPFHHPNHRVWWHQDRQCVLVCPSLLVWSLLGRPSLHYLPSLLVSLLRDP